MIIVKQDKKGIVNFNNVTDIYIDKEDDGDRHFVFYIPVSNIDGLDILGIYETEERAKEVLQEIIKAYIENKKTQETTSIFGFSIIPSNTYYEMPKEW